LIRYWLGGLLLVLLLLMLSSAVLAQEVLVKDQSLVIEENGRPVGVKLSRLWRTDTGYKYIIDLNYQLVLPGGGTDQTTKHLELFVDKSYYAKSFNILSNHNRSITQTDGLFQNNQMKLTTTAAGQANSTVFQVEEPVYFRGSLFDFLGAAGQLKAGETFQMNIFDPETQIFTEDSFTVAQGEYKYQGKTIALLSVTRADSPEPSAFINLKGECFWEYDSRLKLVLRKIDSLEFPELQLRLGQQGMIPGKAKVSYPLRSISSQIRLALTHLKPDQYPLEDNRQKISERKTTGNRSDLLLAIHRDDRDFTGKITLPVKKKELAPYLAGSSTDFIAPGLTEVKKITGEILGDESDGWRTAQKLVNWVSAYIHPAVLPKTLKTGEILAQKAGDSEEYAILFAALARSAGLPVRIAAGMRFQDGIWVGYTWNEVWLGEWVAVDPSQNQVAPDALLLKLAHGDTIAGVQKMKAGFTGNLEVDLMDVQIPEPETAEMHTVKTGVYGLTYVNTDYQCQIKAPEGWKLVETVEQDMPVLVAQPVANKDITGVLTMFCIPEETTLEQYLELHFPGLQVDIAQYQLIKQQSVVAETVLSPAGNFTFANNDMKFRQQNWLATYGNRGYLLVCLTPEAEWAGFENDFNTLRNQFAIKE
jgi:hypothetical protein